MTPQELRAAAELVESTYATFSSAPDGRLYNTLAEEAALKLARHVLATVRADDDEPVTVEWLMSIGFRHMRQSWTHCDYYEMPFPYQEINATVSPEMVIALYGPCQIRIVKPTRGQVRDLLRALGREVKG